MAARAVRLGDDGYRIPTPAEDIWEKERANLSPKPADDARVHQEIIAWLWEPQPSHALLGVKPFKAALFLNNRLIVDGVVVTTRRHGDHTVAWPLLEPA